MFKLNIRRKLLLSFGSIFFIILFSSSLVSYYIVSDDLNTVSKAHIEQITKSIAHLTQAALSVSSKSYLRAISEKNKVLVEMIYEKGISQNKSNEEILNDIRKIFLNPKYGKIGKTGYLAGVSGKGILTIHPDSEGVDASKWDFMKKATRQKNGFISYSWKNKGEEKARDKIGWMSYFKPLDIIIWASAYKSEFRYLLNPNEIKKEILSIKIGTSGYPYIINSKGNVIIHPYLKEGENVLNFQDEKGKFFIKEMLEKKNGWVTYYWKKLNSDEVGLKYTNFVYIPELDWLVACGIYDSDLFAVFYNNRLVYLLIVTFAFFIFLLTLILISKSFTKPIQSMVEKLKLAKEGDFTSRLPVLSNDEIGKTAEIVNELLDSLSKITSEITNNVNSLNYSTKEMTSISQEVNSTASEQAAAVSEVVATVEEFASMSKQIEKNAGGVAQLASKTEKDVEQGAGTVNTTLERMKVIKQSNQKNISEITKLGKRVEQINEVLKFINNIADQTKLIAFNAALEASSSAGESGKRFGIVATEIRRLADNIVESITDIENTIEDIRIATDELTISFENSSIRIEEGYMQAEETSTVLSTILNSSKKTSKSARQIDNGTSQQRIASEQIVSVLKEISEGIQQFVVATKHSDDITKEINILSKKFTDSISNFQINNSFLINDNENKNK